MNINAYDICLESLKKKHQVLIFVHSRKETVKLSEFMIERATERSELSFFLPEKCNPAKLSRRVENKDLKNIV